MDKQKDEWLFRPFVFFVLLGKYKIAALEKFGVVAISRKTV